jgi:cytochrome c2
VKLPTALLAAGVAALGVAWLVLGEAKAKARVRTAIELTGGDPRRGPDAILQHGCVTCHDIPGVRGAKGKVGPPLEGMRSRMYVGGVLVNTPSNLIRWIRDPKAVDEKTAMPATGVSLEDARDIASYLYTLK